MPKTTDYVEDFSYILITEETVKFGNEGQGGK